MIAVLRLGHRAGRDPRISTHCALVARAFGARILFYSGDHDGGLEDSVNSIVRNWGGDFRIEYEKGWRKRISGWKGARVHLTMYGMPVLKKISEIRKSGRSKDLLVIIGGEKVHWEVYQMVDYNISVTGQPHSEVAALAVFLHELQEGREMRKPFRGAKIRVIPQERGKRTAKV